MTEEEDKIDTFALESLITRLSNADGPDRELDAMLAAWYVKLTFPLSDLNEWLSAYRDDVYHHAAKFTDSIDYAMTLFDKKRFVIVSFKNGDLDHKYQDVREHDVWSVLLAPINFVVKDPMEILHFPSSKHKYPAIAMCIAALRSMSYESSLFTSRTGL